MSEDSTSPKLSLVVPLYNEEDNVEPMQQEVSEVLDGIDYELVLVDDGSTDATVERIQKGERVRILKLDQNTGQSAAMYEGMMRAKGELIALIDGDLQNDPNDISKLMDALEAEGADLVCGYRANRKDTAFKRLQSRIANGVRSRFTGDGVRDTGCSLKVMRRECREALVPFTGMHRFIPALIKNAGYNVIEQPVNHRARKHGDSKYGGGLARAKPATEDMFGVQWLNSRRFSVKVTEE
ncbi:MAG: glycosyltransferase family 2 protein [Verrucomicrobiota bacterium]